MPEFCGLTGYNRGYWSWLLRNCGRKVVLRGRRGEQVTLVGEVKKIKRERERDYDEEVKEALKNIWASWMEVVISNTSFQLQ